MTAGPSETLTIAERVERALVVLAYCIELDGDVHLPMYERFEEEFKTLKKRQEARERAKQLLAAYTDAGALRQIR
jgi:hypothetical protein